MEGPTTPGALSSTSIRFDQSYQLVKDLLLVWGPRGLPAALNVALRSRAITLTTHLTNNRSLLKPFIAPVRPPELQSYHELSNSIGQTKEPTIDVVEQRPGYILAGWPAYIDI